jgi:hypothetical protein
MIERFANGFAQKFLMGKPLGFDIDDVYEAHKNFTRPPQSHQFSDERKDQLMLCQSLPRALLLCALSLAACAPQSASSPENYCERSQNSY